MYEISLTNGFGPIKFGITPSAAKSAWGDELCYEDWMGGNLENFLYFKGLLVGFRGEVGDCPTENSHVCMFQVKTEYPLCLWGQEITHSSKEMIESLLKNNNVQYKSLPNNIVQCTTRELQFQFIGGKLDEVYFASKNS